MITRSPENKTVRILPPDFNELYSAARKRSDRAAAVVRGMHAEQPFTSRDEIQAAFQAELRVLEAAEFSYFDRIEFQQLGITL